jgi:hypothetical protein
VKIVLISEVLKNRPRVYHMAHLKSWPTIQEHGLLSTTALLDLFEYQGTERFRIESQWRPNSVPIKHSKYGTAWIRDQWVMPEEELRKVLVNMSPREWYEFLNRHTFFWGEERRLITFLNAQNYKNKSHCVLVANTRKLIERYSERILLSKINSGYVYWGGTRGKNTFQPISAFLSSSYIWELAIDYSIPDITEILDCVEIWKNGERLECIWEP